MPRVVQSRSCKRSETLIQISLLLFLTWREYFYSQPTHFCSQQKSKDLIKVSLLLQDLASTFDPVTLEIGGVVIQKKFVFSSGTILMSCWMLALYSSTPIGPQREMSQSVLSIILREHSSTSREIKKSTKNS